MKTTRFAFDLEMFAAARRESSERRRRRWSLALRRLLRPTKREAASRLCAWRLAMARAAETQEDQRRQVQSSNGCKAYIHRSMRMAIEAIDQGDQSMARRHVELGIERWEAEGLPLYGQPQSVNNVE